LVTDHIDALYRAARALRNSRRAEDLIRETPSFLVGCARGERNGSTSTTDERGAMTNCLIHDTQPIGIDDPLSEAAKGGWLATHAGRGTPKLARAFAMSFRLHLSPTHNRSRISKSSRPAPPQSSTSRSRKEREHDLPTR
jgi:hypothetical protein